MNRAVQSSIKRWRESWVWTPSFCQIRFCPGRSNSIVPDMVSKNGQTLVGQVVKPGPDGYGRLKINPKAFEVVGNW